MSVAQIALSDGSLRADEKEVEAKNTPSIFTEQELEDPGPGKLHEVVIHHPAGPRSRR